MTAPRGGRQSGFTLVEVMIVAALVVPLLLVVGVSSRAVVGSVQANDRAAEIGEAAVEALDQIERVLHFGQLGTMRAVATSDDVRDGLAGDEGDLFAMPQLTARDQLELYSMTGERDLALATPSRLFRLQFVLDAGENADGDDDDGDGMIDEGELQLVRDGITTRLLDGVEQCEFELEGRVVRVTLRYARPGHGDDVRRTTLQQTVLVNNY